MGLVDVPLTTLCRSSVDPVPRSAIGKANLWREQEIGISFIMSFSIIALRRLSRPDKHKIKA
jgi:hypothetical protein